MSTYAVTGAASGIGAATASRLRGDGHTVITIDLHDADVNADLSTAAGRHDAVSRVTETCGGHLDGIVPCAGLAGRTGVDPRLLVSVNYFGAVELVTGLRGCLGEGSAVVLLSSNSTTFQPGWSAHLADAMVAGDEVRARDLAGRGTSVMAYPASKAALAWWARTEGLAWAADGIRVNCVAPGLISTPMTDEVRKDPVFGRYADSYPSALKRPGRPEEIAAVIAFLLSAESSLLVGSVVVADGGTDAIKNPRVPRGRLTGRVASTLTGLGIKALTRGR